MRMEIELCYGREGLKVELPHGMGLSYVVRKKPMPVLPKPEEATIEALRRPIGTGPLRTLARGKKNACIVVSDITRPVPNQVLLPSILEELQAGGIKRQCITILIANAIHRPSTDEELLEMLGPEILADYRVLHHHCQDPSSLSFLGYTSAQIPVYVNKTYVESDFKVLTGLIEPHLMAGYSGGRKSIAPGLSSLQTVQLLHSPNILEEPLAKNCQLAGNPCHQQMVEIARMAGADFIANVVIDEKRRICGLFCGHLEEAHERGCHFADQYMKVPLPEKVDVILTTSAGYPLDKTYYQAIKGLVGPLDIVEEGGVILMAAQLSEGLGSAHFKNLLSDLKECTDIDCFLAHISKPENFIMDQWQAVELIKVLRKADVHLFSEGLREEEFSLARAKRVASIRATVQEALRMRGGEAKLAVIPEGPYVVPYLA